MLDEYASQRAKFNALLNKYGVKSTGASLRRSHKTTLVVYVPNSEFDDNTKELVEDSATEFFQCEVDKSRVVPAKDSMAVQMLLAL